MINWWPKSQNPDRRALASAHSARACLWALDALAIENRLVEGRYFDNDLVMVRDVQCMRCLKDDQQCFRCNRVVPGLL